MARAGGGGHSSGGFHSSGGHVSSSHSGGGHRASFGGSSRAGSSRSSSSTRSSAPRTGGFGGSAGPSVWNTSSRRNTAPPIIINNGGGYGGMSGLFGRKSSGGNGCGCVAAVVFVIVMIIILTLVMSMISGPSGESQSVYYTEVPASSYNREKLENTSWDGDCVIDEIGWISEDGSISGLERKLRDFYDETGVQPFVYLVGYRSDLVTDSDKERFASSFYENEIGNDYTFAFFYFCEYNPDDVGYMYYEGGSRALGVMDPEAIDIFWAICDSEWYSDATTEDALANTFNRTASRIMTKTATGKDIGKIVLIIVLVIVVAAAIVFIMNKKRKLEKERSEETRKILETPLDDLASIEKDIEK